MKELQINNLQQLIPLHDQSPTFMMDATPTFKNQRQIAFYSCRKPHNMIKFKNNLRLFAGL